MSGTVRIPAPRLLEFFSGIGLARLALEAEGARCVFANDSSAEKCRTYRANFGSGELRECAVADLDPRSIPDADVAWASFPCTDITMCGSRRGFAGPQSSPVWQFLNAIAGMRRADREPRVLILENVLGMLGPTMVGGTLALLNAIWTLGYDLDMVRIDAGWFTPQSRRRVFVVARHSSYGPAGIPASAALAMPFRGGLVRRIVVRTPEIRWRFLDLPMCPCVPDPGGAIADIVSDPAEDDEAWLPADRMSRLLSKLARNQRDHRALLDRYRAARGTFYLSASESGLHGEEGGTALFLREDKVNCLLRPNGGNARRWIVRVRDGEVRVRPLSGVEHARLQGVGLHGAFPTFALPPGEAACKRAFADAVCVPAVRWLYRHGIRPATASVPESRLSQALNHARTDHARLLRQSHLRRTIEAMRGC